MQWWAGGAAVDAAVDAALVSVAAVPMVAA